jgi:hypothetical protein
MGLIGILTGMVAVVIDFSVENLSEIKYSFIAKSDLNKQSSNINIFKRLISLNLIEITQCTTDHCLWEPLLAWITINTLCASISCSMVLLLAVPFKLLIQ